MGNPAEQKPVRRRLLCDDWQRSFVEIGHQLCRFLRLQRFGIYRQRLWNWQAFPMWIGITERTFQPFSAEHHHKTVSLPRPNDYLCIPELLYFLRQQFTKL